MANPGFPREEVVGGVNHYLTNFFRKLHENEILAEGLSASLVRPHPQIRQC